MRNFSICEKQYSLTYTVILFIQDFYMIFFVDLNIYDIFVN